MKVQLLQCKRGKKEFAPQMPIQAVGKDVECIFPRLENISR